jgi:hypothetical protein
VSYRVLESLPFSAYCHWEDTGRHCSPCHHHTIMAHINVLKYAVSSPADTTPLKELKAAGYDSKDILAVIGKSEGKHPVSKLCLLLILLPRKWLRQRLLSDSQYPRMGTSYSRVCSYDLFRGNRGRAESSCDVHRPRLKTNRPSSRSRTNTTPRAS